MPCINKARICAVKKVHPNANLPVYATDGAAAADVTCVQWKDVEGNWQDSSVMVNPGASVILDTGLQFDIPYGFELKCHSRSGHGFKHGIRLANCTGILDSDYRGNLMVKLHNDSNTAFRIEMGERVLQVQVKAAPQVPFTEVMELSVTQRGAAGFGSTGVGAIEHPMSIQARTPLTCGDDGVFRYETVSHHHTASTGPGMYDHNCRPTLCDGAHTHTISLEGHPSHAGLVKS